MAEKEITNNQLAVMIEKVGSDVKAVAEGHQVIRSEMKQMEERLTEKIDRVERTLDEHVKLPAHA